MSQEDSSILSPYIKQLLAMGSVNKVSRLLGKYHSLNCKIIKKHNNKLKLPTIRLEALSALNALCHGVYLVTTKVNNCDFAGIVYIDKSIDIHLWDFDMLMLQAIMTIDLIQFIRPVRKFANQDMLDFQIAMDNKGAKFVFDNLDQLSYKTYI